MTANDKEHLVFLLDQLYNLIKDNEDNSAIYCCVINDYNENYLKCQESIIIVGTDKIIDKAIQQITERTLDFYTK